jgi:hypothetical protein
MYGTRPRSRKRDCERTTAIRNPISAPRRKPASASLPVNHVASSLVEVGHRHIVDRERPLPARGLPQPLVALPKADQRGEDEDAGREPPSHSSIRGDGSGRGRDVVHALVITTAGRSL